MRRSVIQTNIEVYLCCYWFLYFYIYFVEKFLSLYDVSLWRKEKWEDEKYFARRIFFEIFFTWSFSLSFSSSNICDLSFSSSKISNHGIFFCSQLWYKLSCTFSILSKLSCWEKLSSLSMSQKDILRILILRFKDFIYKMLLWLGKRCIYRAVFY